MTLTQITNELIIRCIPFDTALRRKALSEKYLSSVNIKGKNVLIRDDISIKRRTALILGENIEIAGNNFIDASAGILIGDNCKIDKNIRLNSNLESGYDPIIIGAGNHVSKDVNPGTIMRPTMPIKGLSSFDGQLVFILSTGRSGSKAIAKMIDQHKDAECYHDTFTHLNTWSCDYLYDKSKKEVIKNKLLSLYNATSLGQGKIFGQSDQKIAPLVPILTELFPTAKFIWLIRDPYEFVNSGYARGWFDNSEFGYPKNEKEFFKKEVTPSRFDAYHRCSGVKVGAFTEDEWRIMTAFERICWYWSYWNDLIETNLETLPKKLHLKVKLEELQQQKDSILEFVGLPSNSYKAEKVNTAYYRKPDKSQWTLKMNTIFENYCEDRMKKWGY